MPKLPQHPRPYTFTRTPDLAAITTYAHNLLQYVADRTKYNADYDTAKKLYDKAKPSYAAIEKQVIELIQEDVGLARLNLSEKKVEKLWQKAWDDASNEDEAISNLRELVELFED
jgi:oligoendopeptidase F